MEITLCNTASCPSAACCYRFTVPQSSPEQSEFSRDPRKEDGSCEHFLPMPGNCAPTKGAFGAALILGE